MIGVEVHLRITFRRSVLECMNLTSRHANDFGLSTGSQERGREVLGLASMSLERSGNGHADLSAY